MADTTEVSIGTVIAQKFQIEARLGGGAFGDVYLALDPKLKRRVAIKLLKADSDGDLAEARALAQLTHPNAVQIYETGQHGRRPFLVLEYVEGNTLESLLGTGALPVLQAAQITRKLASALAAVHQRNIVHCDVKPGNVILTATLEPKLGDFGIVQYADNSTLAAGWCAGTRRYMSPEQLAGQALTPKSDVYSLALVFIEMLTGKPSADPAAADHVLSAVIAREQLADILRGMLEGEAAARPDAATVEKRLQDWEHDVAGTSTRHDSESQPRIAVARNQLGRLTRNGIIEIFDSRIDYEKAYPLKQSLERLGAGNVFRVVGRSLYNLMNHTKLLQEAMLRGVRVELCFSKLTSRVLGPPEDPTYPGELKTARDICHRELELWAEAKHPPGSVETRFHHLTLWDSFTVFDADTDAFCVWDVSFARNLGEKYMIVAARHSPFGANLWKRYDNIYQHADAGARVATTSKPGPYGNHANA